MDSPNIPKDQLPSFLPKHVIREALGSPQTPFQLPPSPTCFMSPTNAESPQIPPLESRLYDYVFRDNSKQYPRCQLNLTDLFDTLQVHEEIEKEIEKICTDEVSLFSALEQDRIFEQAQHEIQRFLEFDRGEVLQADLFKSTSN